MSLSLTKLVDQSVASLHHARAARSQRRQLASELASYRTSAERAELGAILSRHTADDLERLSLVTGTSSRAA